LIDQLSKKSRVICAWTFAFTIAAALSVHQTDMRRIMAMKIPPAPKHDGPTTPAYMSNSRRRNRQRRPTAASASPDEVGATPRCDAVNSRWRVWDGS